MVATFGIEWWVGFVTGFVFALCLLALLVMAAQLHIDQLGRKNWPRFDPDDNDEDNDEEEDS